MAAVDTLVIGAGQSGLAVSWHLHARGLDHVVVDRGRIAERWRSERWDSLRTLTPNWMTRLPGFSYGGTDPDGFMTMTELVQFFEGYARSFPVPLVEGSAVTSVARDGGGFRVVTAGTTWLVHNVVIATGWADQAFVPASSGHLPTRVQQVTSAAYRRPDQIAGDHVVVVGASASGVQIASELAAAGRDVTLAVGRHRRVPRSYRGRDIMWWLDRLGTLDRRPRDDGERRRLLHEPSLQLSARARLDIATLAAGGVGITGRLEAVDSGRLWFADDLRSTLTDAELRLRSLLERIDRLTDDLGELAVATPIAPIDVTPAPRSLSARTGGVDAVVWATGFRRSYPWLHVPVLHRDGEISHDGGITNVPGIFTAGMRFQSGRRSTFIDGARFDAPVVADAIERRGAARKAA
jgi:putative flavoprotein involved in K+ transport